MTPSPDAGVVIVDGAGGVAWSAAAVPAVAAIALDIAPGIAVTVDIARPAVVLAWTVAPGASPGALGDVCADPALADLIDTIRADGESVRTFDGRRLSAPWAHRAFVAAVTRWILRPIDGTALLLDTAVAEHRIGDAATARRILRFADYALADLATDTSRELSSSATDLVLAALETAEAVGATSAAADLRDDLRGRRGDDAAALESLAQWRISAADLFAGTAALDELVTDPEVDYGVVDPWAVPPRILAWNGARGIEVTAARIDAEIVVRAPLAAGVDPTCTEVNELLAYVSSNGSGDVIAVAPATVEQDAVVARFAAIDGDLGSLGFGFFGAALEPRNLRCDQIGSRLVDIDRLLLDAWNNEREAVATLHTVGSRSTSAEVEGARDAYETLMTAAQTAASNGAVALSSVLADVAVDSPVSKLLSGRLAAIAAYEEDLADLAREYPAPLLAELLAPDDV